MYASTSKLLEAAEALEKCAEYFEREDSAEIEKRAKTLKTEYIDPITSGTNADPTLSEKLAQTDPEVLKFIKDLSDTRAGSNEDLNLGGASEKYASDDMDPLLAFCVSDD